MAMIARRLLVQFSLFKSIYWHDKLLNKTPCKGKYCHFFHTDDQVKLVKENVLVSTALWMLKYLIYFLNFREQLASLVKKAQVETEYVYC
jgi:hypothetical protein